MLNEYTVQCQICNTLRRLNLFFFKITNEQKFKQLNPKAYAAKLKAEGFKSGAPDLAVLLPNGITVWLEVKRPAVMGIGKSGKPIIVQAAGKQSPAQEKFEQDVKLLGHYYFVVKTPQEAFAAIEQVKEETSSLKIGGTD